MNKKQKGWEVKLCLKAHVSGDDGEWEKAGRGSYFMLQAETTRKCARCVCSCLSRSIYLVG